MTLDIAAHMHADVSIEVDDVDNVHARAVAAGADIVYPLTDESWGLRRFFVRDPNGAIINVTQHEEQRRLPRRRRGAGRNRRRPLLAHPVVRLLPGDRGTSARLGSHRPRLGTDRDGSRAIGPIDQSVIADREDRVGADLQPHRQGRGPSRVRHPKRLSPRRDRPPHASDGTAEQCRACGGRA